MKILFLFFIMLFSTILMAQKDYSLRVAYGKSTQSDLGDVLIGQSSSDIADLRTTSIDGGYLLEDNLFDSPLSLYVRSSLSVFDEAAIQPNVYEVTLYLKFYYAFHPFGETLRFGFGEGVSYTTNILLTEAYGARERNDNTSHYLNYLDISLDVDIGKIFHSSYFKDVYIGWLIKHRSGVFGLIHNVHHGGSNYNCIMIEKNF